MAPVMARYRKPFHCGPSFWYGHECDGTDVHHRLAFRMPGFAVVVVELLALVDRELRAMELARWRKCYAMSAFLEGLEQLVGGIKRVGQRGLRHEHVDEVLLKRAQVPHLGETPGLEELADACNQLVAFLAPRRPRSGGRVFPFIVDANRIRNCVATGGTPASGCPIQMSRPRR